MDLHYTHPLYAIPCQWANFSWTSKGVYSWNSYLIAWEQENSVSEPKIHQGSHSQMADSFNRALA